MISDEFNYTSSYECSLKENNDELLRKNIHFSKLPVHKMEKILGRTHHYLNLKYDLTRPEMLKIKKIKSSKNALTELFSDCSKAEMVSIYNTLNRFTSINTISNPQSHDAIISLLISLFFENNPKQSSVFEQYVEEGSLDISSITAIDLSQLINQRLHEMEILPKTHSSITPKEQITHSSFGSHESFQAKLCKSANENLSLDQLKFKYAKLLGLNPSILKLPEVKEWIFKTPIFDEITDKKSYNDAKQNLSDFNITQNGKDIKIIRRSSNKNTSAIDVRCVNGNTFITTVEPEYFGNKNYTQETRMFNNFGIEVGREIQDLAKDYYTGKPFVKSQYLLERIGASKVKQTFSGYPPIVYDLSFKDGDVAALYNPLATTRLPKFNPYENVNDSIPRILNKFQKSSKSTNLMQCYGKELQEQYNLDVFSPDIVE